MPIARSILNDFNAEAEHSRKLLAAVPEEHFAWKPHEKSWSLAELAGHIAEAPKWVHSMQGSHFDLEEADGGNYKPFVPASAADLLAAFEKNVAGFREALTDRDDAFMTATWTMSAGGQQIMSLPRADAIRSILIHHVAHHRGQLTVYLRLLDVAVPPTYGPTADSAGG